MLADKIKAAGGGSTNGDDEFLTQEQRVQDKWVKERIGQTLKDYESEMQANQARGEFQSSVLNVGIDLKRSNLQLKKKNEGNRRRKKIEPRERMTPAA